MPSGLLISKEGEGGRWSINLHPMNGGLESFLPTLSSAKLVKGRDDGGMLIEGLEWDEGALDQWRQTWLCAPTVRLAEDALEAMAPWLEAHYNRARWVRARQKS